MQYSKVNPRTFGFKNDSIIAKEVVVDIQFNRFIHHMHSERHKAFLICSAWARARRKFKASIINLSIISSLCAFDLPITKDSSPGDRDRRCRKLGLPLCASPLITWKYNGKSSYRNLMNVTRAQSVNVHNLSCMNSVVMYSSLRQWRPFQLLQCTFHDINKILY